MKPAIVLASLGILALTAAAPASAQVSVNFGINPCGYPALYQNCAYYGPPVGVYVDRGTWGGDRGWRGSRNGRRDRGDHGYRDDHGNRGDHGDRDRHGGGDDGSRRRH